MGRKEDRQRSRVVNKKLTKGQFNQLQGDINQEFINREVAIQTKKFREFFSDCFIDAVIKNNISQSKALSILDDVAIIMKRKVSEKREKKNGES